MIHWKDVTRATALAALLAGTTAAQPPGRVPPGDLPPFPPPPFGHAWLEPRVEGVPYRAQSMIEFGGNADGNASARRTTGIVARDAAGRTRREDAVGPGAHRIVVIDDPVADMHYVLFPERAAGRTFAEPRGAWQLGSMGERFYSPRNSGGAPPAKKTESLGTEVVAGVEAEGTRDTITIPAGVHGNESPVEVVSERWYSPELKAVVRLRHRGPRIERTWTLTDITRGEPEASLFEVPAGFEIAEGHR